MDPTINPETGETIVSDQSSRFNMWVALTLFSVVVMGASVDVKNDEIWPNSDIKWSVACSVVTFLIAGAFSGFHLYPLTKSLSVGTPMEGSFAFTLAVFWACTVAVVDKTDTDLVFPLVSNAAEVKNANLYYFSWACFISSCLLLITYLREAFGLDMVAEARNRAARLSLWGALLATSLVVVGASCRILNTNCPYDEMYGGTVETFNSRDSMLISESFCPRTKFGLAVGVVGVVVACILVACKLSWPSVPFTLEFRFAMFASVMWAIGVAFVTSNDGPGAFIGNLYYFSWFSFLIVVHITVDCFRVLQTAPSIEADPADQMPPTVPEQPHLAVEPLDEDKP